MNKGIIKHRFNVQIICSRNTNESCIGPIYEDVGVLMLPNSYSEKGVPTVLVINCHGAGGTVETDDSQTERQVLTKYLLANGYAVMDVNGLPKDYANIMGIDVRNNIGSPIALQSYVKAYHYCIEHFNLKKEVFVHGSSMGGISSTNLVLSGEIPVIAQSGFCPVLDTYNQIFLHPWSKGLPKTALGLFYDMKKDDKGEFIYDEAKVEGFNPMARCKKIDGIEQIAYPVPVKFWHCENDDVVNIATTKRFVSAIQNAGSIAYLKTFPEGKHEPQLYGVPINNPRGNCVMDNEVLAINPAIEEAFLWIDSFNNFLQN